NNTTRCFVAVQLQHVRIERVDDVEQHLIVRIDCERDLDGAAVHTLTERACSLKADVTRARGKEYEANEVGPGIERYIKRLRGLKPANFDRQRHYEARSTALSTRPQSGTCRSRKWRRNDRIRGGIGCPRGFRSEARGQHTPC